MSVRKNLLLVCCVTAAGMSFGCVPVETIDPVPQAKTVVAALDIDIRGATVLSATGVSADDVTMTLEIGETTHTDLLPNGAVLVSQGRIEPIPEAGAEIYMAKLDGGTSKSGPCAGQALSWSLALHHRIGTLRAAGGLTAYCETSHVPIRVLRLTGTLDGSDAF